MTYTVENIRTNEKSERNKKEEEEEEESARPILGVVRKTNNQVLPGSPRCSNRAASFGMVNAHF